jgi:hypothetical protein
MEKASPFFEGGKWRSPASSDDVKNVIFLRSVIPVIVCFKDSLHACLQKEPMESISIEWISIHGPPFFQTIDREKKRAMEKYQLKCLFRR